MNRTIFSLVLVSVIISSIAQILLKAGMNSQSIKNYMKGDIEPSILVQIMTNLYVISGLALYFFGAIIWLFVLSKVQVSTAYPFVALGFVLVAVFGRLFFHDEFALNKIIGTILIIFGVIVLARG